MRNVKYATTSLLRSGIVWFFLLSLPPGLLLLRGGYFVSHDGLFHLHRLAGLDRALHGGILYPRWFPEFAYGYGHPVLNYYSPLAYYLGEFFHLWGAGFILSTKLAFLAGLLLSGLAFYLWTRDSWGRFPALVGAVAYLYAPYHLADTYVRGALAESLAFVFMPLILWSTERFFAKEEGSYLVLGGLAYGGLILAHNLTSLIFTPFALAYAIFWAKRRWKPLAIWALSFLLALGLTAFYWLPALTEALGVGLAEGMASTGYRKHLAPLVGSISPSLLYRYFPHQGVAAEHPLGLIQALAIIASFPLTLHLAKTGRRREAWGLAFFLALAIVPFFMTLTFSLPLWKLLEPILTPLQYPWRFMALTSLGVACLTGGAIYGLRVSDRGPLGYAMGAAFLLLFPLSGLSRLPLESLPLTEEEVNVVGMWDHDFAHRQIGTTWTAEYLPVWVRADRSEIPLPPSHPLSAEGAISDDDRVVLVEKRYLSYRLQVKSDGMRLRLHTFYLPGWQGYIDGVKVDSYPSGDFGLVTLEIPRGEHRVDLRFEGTGERRLGCALSSVALLLLMIALLRYKKRWLYIPLAIFLLLAGLLAFHLKPFAFATQPVVREANLEGKVRLLGYSPDKGVYHPGEEVKVTLYWLSLQAMREDYKVFVHLMDEGETKMWAQHDDNPVGGFTPTTRWRPGELILDRHELLLPEETPPGSYKIFTGMYEYETVRNLTILEGGRPDNRVLLGRIEVR